MRTTARTRAAGQEAAAAEDEPRIDSRQLLAGRPSLIIEHGNERYRLQQTRSGKLILTK